MFCDERQTELEAARRAKCDRLPRRPQPDGPNDGSVGDPHSDITAAPVVRMPALRGCVFCEPASGATAVSTN
jgi:hypothetical protein